MIIFSTSRTFPLKAGQSNYKKKSRFFLPDEGEGQPELEPAWPAQLVRREPGLRLLVSSHLLHPAHHLVKG